MKLTYLSRTMNRALGSIVILFLPGIYVSVCYAHFFPRVRTFLTEPRPCSARASSISHRAICWSPMRSGFSGLSSSRSRSSALAFWSIRQARCGIGCAILFCGIGKVKEEGTSLLGLDYPSAVTGMQISKYLTIRIAMRSLGDKVL